MGLGNWVTGCMGGDNIVGGWVHGCEWVTQCGWVTGQVGVGNCMCVTLWVDDRVCECLQ